MIKLLVFGFKKPKVSSSANILLILTDGVFKDGHGVLRIEGHGGMIQKGNKVLLAWLGFIQNVHCASVAEAWAIYYVVYSTAKSSFNRLTLMMLLQLPYILIHNKC